MTHQEWSAKVANATPCTAHHVNFGGQCLNCGWVPVRSMRDFESAERGTDNAGRYLLDTMYPEYADKVRLS